MNTAALQSLVQLPIESIRASATNPRQHFDPAGLTELSASIAEVGIQVPLLVRPMFDPDDGELQIYELVAGERRYRAAKGLGLETIPCLAREMTDEEAREAQIIENLQRVDVHPIEEAEAFSELLGRMGSIAGVAAKVSKEQSYVAKCLRLLSLTLHSRDALRGRAITIDHALLLARLGEGEQNEALKWTLDRNAGSKTTVAKVVEDRIALIKQEDGKTKSRFYGYVWEPETVQKLKSHIEGESGVKLSRAPWKTQEEDCLLPDVVGCSECDKNTKANAPLFGDLAIDDPTCTDGSCFQAKTAGFVQIALRVAGQDESVKPKKLVPRLSWKASSVRPSVVPNNMGVTGAAESTADPSKVLKQAQWVEAKKGSCPNVRAAVTMDWSDSGQRGYMGGNSKLRKPGETLQVCIAVGCKIHRKDWEKPKSANRNAYTPPDPAEEKRKREEQEFIEKEESKIRAKIFDAILAKLDASRALRLVTDEDQSAPSWRKRILALFPAIGGDQLEAYTAFCGTFSGECRVNAYWMMQQGGVVNDRKDLWALAKKVGVDASAVTAKHFHDAGSIAPAADRLYPKGVPWPKDSKPGAAATKTPVKKVAAKAKAKPVKKLTAEGRKSIADVIKKRWAARTKPAKKKVG